MALSYYFSFTAPASTTAGELESFLKKVERKATKLGFEPTTVLNIPFDNPERREFARRLGGGITVTDVKLVGAVMVSEADACRHDPVEGSCRLVPEHGVVLVLTDERGVETCFGFFKFAPAIRDTNGKPIAATEHSGRWAFSNYTDSPDMRFREIVDAFAKAGYLERESDDYAPKPARP